jgi:hypothetical protein
MCQAGILSPEGGERGGTVIVWQEDSLEEAGAEGYGQEA